MGSRGHEVAGILGSGTVADEPADATCATPEAKIRFLDTFVNPPCWPGPKDICPDHFIVEPFDLVGVTDRRCAVCGEVCHDHSMLMDEAWQAFGFSPKQNAHLACLPKKPALEDFTDAPINDAIRFGHGLNYAEAVT